MCLLLLLLLSLLVFNIIITASIISIADISIIIARHAGGGPAGLYERARRMQAAAEEYDFMCYFM